MTTCTMYIDMCTFIQFIECPEAFNVEAILTQNPQYFKQLIDLISTTPDPLLSNERECYVHPSRAMELLSMGSIYKLFNQHMYLEYLLSNLKKCLDQPILLGYVNTVLLSLVHKTPEIYEFLKDNEQYLTFILNEDRLLAALKEFMAALLSESTMDLYVFLKSMCIRTLVTRIVEEGTPVIYDSIAYFYETLIKAGPIAPEDERNQLTEICSHFEEETFLSLLTLKIDPLEGKKTENIGRFLLMIAQQPATASLLLPHLDLLDQYFEQHEESSSFLYLILPDQIQLLKVLCQLSTVLDEEHLGELLKRLLVYSSVHCTNSVIHTMLYNLIVELNAAGKKELLGSVVEFVMKTQSKAKLGFASLRRKICRYWIESKLVDDCNEEQKAFVSASVANMARLADCKHYHA